MKTKITASALSLLLFAAGCSSANSTQQGTSEPQASADQSTESAAGSDAAAADQNTASASALDALKQLGAGNISDEDGLSAWTALLSQTAQTNQYSLDVDASSEVYLYQDVQDNQMAESEGIYEIGRDAVFMQNGSKAVSANLTDVDDSFDTLIAGYGVLESYGDKGVEVDVNLSDTEDDTLKGTINAINPETGTTTEDGAVELLMESLSGYGYVRNVDPFHNASLYSYDLKEQGSDYTLTLKVADLEAFGKAANVKTVLYNNQNNMPLLVLNDAQEDAYTFTFDGNGNLKEVINTVEHVIVPFSDQYKDSYVSLYNQAKVEKADGEDMNAANVEAFLNQASDGSLKAGDAFTLSGWK